MALKTDNEITQEIKDLKLFWNQRNLKFRDWYSLLVLLDQLASKGMETYVSNEPMTFYNMAHYLLTKGELSHTTSILNDSALELDKRAKIDRSCKYLWKTVDRDRQLGGNQPFIDDLAFFLLVLGWYSMVMAFDHNTGLLQSQIWNPYETYPKYGNNRLVSCVHSYSISEEEAKLKAEENGWSFRATQRVMNGFTNLDDYFYYDKDTLYNKIFIGGNPVTGWVDRPNMRILVSPVGGFPDKGVLTPRTKDWRRLTGRGIFEVNEAVTEHFNKWKSMLSQILRDTVQPVTQEISATSQATPEQLRERGGLFHYAPGEAGIQRVPPPVIPTEIQATLLEQRRELQKGAFSDAVYGMVEGQPGYALSLLASSSANQILYPYMDGKHFVISETDKFWLSNLKGSGKVFSIKGKFLEKLESKEIPEDVFIEVNSDVATPKDWLERGTVANMLREHLDEATIVGEILKMSDPQAIKRQRSLDRVLNHPMTIQVEIIAGYFAHAEYLEKRGDTKQASLFRRAAQLLESQLGAPAPGQARPEEMTRVLSQREAGAPSERTRVDSNIAPPEVTGGFTPEELRRSIGRGSLRSV